jgi:hypothetical protein
MDGAFRSRFHSIVSVNFWGWLVWLIEDMWKETEIASVDGWMVSVNEGERIVTLVSGEGMVGCLIHHCPDQEGDCSLYRPGRKLG